MTTQLQSRRGTTVQHSTFTGAEGEVTVDTTKDVVVVHDGNTAGGIPAAREDLSNVSGSNVASKVSGQTVSTIDINGGTIDGTTIGGASAAAGTFTNLTASGTVTLGGTALTATAAELNALDGITATVTELNYTDGVTSNIQTQLNAKAPLASPALTGTPTAPTAVAGTNTTQIATTAFVSTAVSNLVDAAPAALDTLNELAAALGDDASFSTTVTNSIATKVSKSGDSMTGDLSFGDNDKAIFGAGSDLQIYHSGSNSFISDAGTGDLFIQAQDLTLRGADATTRYLSAVQSTGAVTAFYGNAAKLATTSTGIDVTGTVTADGLTVDGSTQFNTGSSGIAEFYHNAGYGGVKVTGGATGSSATLYLSNDKSVTPFDIYTVVGNGSNDSLQFYSGGNPSTGTLRFTSAANGDISFYEDTGTTAKFFWDASAESLGIGTSSPSRALEVQQATNDQLRLSDTSGNGWEVRAGTNFIVKNNGTERMRIDSSGKLLVGTTSPSEKLTVNGGISATYGRSTLVTDNDGNFDLNAGQNFKCTPTGNITLDFTNVPNGQSGFVILDNSGGHTISADATTYRTSDILTQVTAAGVYLISYLTDGTSVYITGSTALANS
jgi:hypothetical protein